MGEAKRRGTPEQRRKEAEIRRFGEEMEREQRRAEHWRSMSPEAKQTALLMAGISVGLIPNLIDKDPQP